MDSGEYEERLEDHLPVALRSVGHLMDASPERDLSTATKLAVERTRLAHERTLMAWIRTAASLISFGFSVYKFFHYLRDSQGAPPSGPIGPREFGALMIAHRDHVTDPRDNRPPAQHARVA